MKVSFAASWNRLSWQARGLCLLLIHQSKDSGDIPTSAKDLSEHVPGSGRYWSEIEPWITDLMILADGRRSISEKRKEAAKARWTPTQKETTSKKPSQKKKVRLTLLKGSSPECFARMWEAWPARGDGKPSRGEKAKAEKLFQEIVDAGICNPYELEEAAVVYQHYPKVQDGFVKMVATFLAREDGMWRECLERVRKGPKAEQLRRMA